MRDIKKYKPGTPEWALAMFFDCWRRRAWRQMLDYVHDAWMEQHGKEASKKIKVLIDSQFIHAQIVQRNNTTPVVAEYLVEVKHRLWGQYTIYTTVLKVRLVKEHKRWGIIPESVAVK